MIIKFPYNETVVERIKEIPGRRWDAEERGWSIPDQYLNIASRILEMRYPDIAKRVQVYADELAPNAQALQELGSAFTPDDIESEQGKNMLKEIRQRLNITNDLFPYQELGVVFLEMTPTRGAIIADAPGLGKTIQTLGWLSIHPELRPVIVVVPASVKKNWEVEIERWMPDKPSVQIIMTGKDKIKPKQEIYIINYELLWKLEDKLLKMSPSVVVFDECTYLKERKAKRTKSSIAVGRKAKYVIGLSGTPILNRPMEFYNILSLISPEQFPSWFKFGVRYCNGFNNGYGWQFRGSSNAKELRSLIQPFMIRRRKEDVLKELPPKRRETIHTLLPGNYQQDYHAADIALMSTVGQLQQSQIDDNDAYTHIFAQLGVLRHIVGRGKAEVAREHILNLTQDNEKLLVFGHHHDVLDYLEEFLKKEKIKYERVDGTTSNKLRQPAIDRFQADEECLVFLTSTAMGMGVNLVAASNALFIERQWSPAIEEQMEDRIHRIGQTKGVVIWYMLVEDTIDSKMASLIESKRELLTNILDSNIRVRDNGVMKALLMELSLN